MLDLNTAEISKPQGQPIPDGTLVPVHMSVRPGGSGPDGWLRRSQAGALMLDCEFTVLEGEYAKRKLWQLYILEGETEGHAKAATISKSAIRSMVESARGIRPSDDSEAAKAARMLSSFEQLDGLRFWIVVKVESREGYAPRNVVKYVVTPENSDWRQLEQQAGAPKSAGPAPERQVPPSAPSTGAARPSWAAKAKTNPADDRIPF